MDVDGNGTIAYPESLTTSARKMTVSGAVLQEAELHDVINEVIIVVNPGGISTIPETPFSKKKKRVPTQINASNIRFAAIFCVGIMQKRIIDSQTAVCT